MEEIKISEAESSEETTEETTNGKESMATSSDDGETNGESSSEESVAEDAVMPDDEVMAEEVMPDGEKTLRGYDRELQIPDFLTNRGKNTERRNNSNTSFSTSPREKKVRKSAKVENSENAKTLREQETEVEAGTADEMTSSNAKAKARSKAESRKESNAEKNTTVYHTSNYVDENADKRKKKKKLKDVLKIALTLCGVAVIALIIILANKLYKSRLQTDENGNLYRNLDYKFAELPEEPVGRIQAWKNELPSFVENDLAQLKKKNAKNLTYEYGSEKIYFTCDLNLISMEEFGYPDDIYYFSMYRDNGAIIIYGTTSSGDFVRFAYTKLNSGYNILGNENVPLNVETTAVEDMIDDYYLCLNEDQAFVCQNKQVITEENVTLSGKARIITTNIGSIYSYPLIYTADNNLYFPILVNNNDKVTLELKKLGNFTLDSNVRSLESIDIEDYLLSIPMLENEDEKILLIPNNLDLYVKYFYRNELMTTDEVESADWQAVPLKQQIIKAVINCEEDEYTMTENKWYVRLYINIADKIATYKYRLDGIDQNADVPKSEKQTYNCYSEDEYWAAVEEIRSLYSKYYSNRPE